VRSVALSLGGKTPLQPWQQELLPVCIESDSEHKYNYLAGIFGSSPEDHEELA